MNTMVVVDQQQQQQGQSTFAPLSTVQPSAAIVNGSLVDSFVLAAAQQQQQNQQSQPPQQQQRLTMNALVNQSPTSATTPGASSTASARAIMFGCGTGAAAGQPGSGHSAKLSLPICSGCGQPILDKYVLHIAPDSTWHADCLRCAECSQLLDETCTCYVRNGHAYCKSDYSKLFGVRCARCQKSFSRLDSIMRVRSPTNGTNVLFHTDCFMCYACGCPLLPGTRFALLGGAASADAGSPTGAGDLTLLLCERDFDDRPHFLQPGQQQRLVRPPGGGGPLLLSGDSPMIENHHPFGIVNGACAAPPHPSQQGQQQPPPHSLLQGLHHMPPPAGPDGIVMLDGPQQGLMSMDAIEALTAAGAVPGQSQHQSAPNGLAHRAAMQQQHHGGSGNGTNNNNSKHHGSSGGDHKVCEKSSSVSSCGSGSTGGNGSKAQMGNGRSRESKTTRVRTVLNEKQLNTLRACYGANPRPDALMKEQLVEMTGLSPRVIRVWFQNKRCKDKKKSMLMKLQAQHLSSSDKVAALQSAMPIIAQDAMQHSGGSPISGTEVAIHAFSQSAWKSLADFAMNADIEPSASYQQFVNGVDGGSSKGLHGLNRHRALQHHSHNHTTSDGISDDDDDDDDSGDDNEVLGDDDDDMMILGSGSGSGLGGGCSSTSPTRGGATTATTMTTGGDDESAGGPFSAAMSIHLAQRQQLLVDTTSATICNRL